MLKLKVWVKNYELVFIVVLNPILPAHPKYRAQQAKQSQGGPLSFIGYYGHMFTKVCVLSRESRQR